MNTTGSSFDPVALRAHRCFLSHDLDDARERISSVLQPHLLEPVRTRSRVAAHMDAVRFGGSVIGILDFGDEMRVHVESMDNYYLFLCTTRGNARLTVGQECTTIGTAAAACSMPDSKFSGSFSEDCEQFFLRVDRATMEAHTGSRHVRFCTELPFKNQAVRAWYAQMRFLATEPDLLKLASHDLRVAHGLERTLLSLLMAGAVCCDSPTDRRTGLAPHVVKRAEAFIEARAADAITLDDIARAVDAPARTLQSAFQKFRGMTPMQALREHRLRLAHTLLLSGEVDSVTDAALRYGIAHLGRFSAMYAERFGESPSKTLSRSRSRLIISNAVGDAGLRPQGGPAALHHS